MCFASLIEPLSVDCHLRVVRAAAWEVRVKWHSLGVELGIKEGTRNVSVYIVQWRRKWGGSRGWSPPLLESTV